jgi:hypothetical protein
VKILRFKRFLRRYDGIASTIKLVDINSGDVDLLGVGLEEEEVAIKEGTYKLRIRDVGGFHNRYTRKFYFHEGMIEVVVPGRKYILLHIGNTIKDTEGCLLMGESLVLQPNQAVGGKHLFIGSSTAAYIDIYKKIIDDVKKKNIVLMVGNN